CMAAPPALAGARGGQRNTARQAARTTRPASTRPARRQIRPQRQTLMRGQRQRQNLGGNRARGEIAAYKSYMEGAIRQNSTPPFFLVPTSSGVQMTQVRQGNYKQNITPKFKVKAPGGKVSFTALL